METKEEEKSMESDYLSQLVELKKPEEKKKPLKTNPVESKIQDDSAWAVTQPLV